MNDIRLEGCRNETLLGYLKSLGIMRIVAKQVDPHVRSSWLDATMIVHTTADEASLVRFFLEQYAPTPVFNPWNNGAGFDDRDGKPDAAMALVERVRGTKGARWQPYRRVVEFLFEEFVRNGERARFLDKKDKDGLLRRLRETCPEEALAWLDAVVILGKSGVAYPFLLGSGGNDGRLDFSVNFIARALDVAGDKPVAQAKALLLDALHDTTTASLLTASIGQFSSRHAGGANATSGFDAQSLVNPWDFVLMIEGALMFSGGIAKRSGGERLGAPFAFRAVGGGYGSASDPEAQEARGEMWLPVWSGSAGFSAIVDLFRKARADLPSNGREPLVRSAAAATEAASAAVTAGVGLGIRTLKRTAFVKRNGLAYVATGAGSVTVSETSDEAIALVTEAVAKWIGRVRGLEIAKGGRLQESLRRFDDTLFDYAQAETAKRDARMRQGLVSALAAIDLALSQKAPEKLAPLRYLDERLLRLLDDGSAEHRLASAIAGLGGAKPGTRFRLDIGHYAIDLKSGRLVYDRSATPIALTDVERSLSAVAQRRARLAGEELTHPWLAARVGGDLLDVAEMLDGGISFDRLGALLAAYAVIEPQIAQTRAREALELSRVPAAFALMKLVMDHPKSRDARIPALLNAGHSERAVALARQRTHTLDFTTGRWRDVAGAVITHPRRYAAALLVPLQQNVTQYSALISAALTPGRDGLRANADAQTYLTQSTSESLRRGA